MIEELLIKLSYVPGLRVIGSYVAQIRDKRTQFSQDMGDRIAQKNSAMEGLRSVRKFPKNVKGSKKKR